MTAKLDYRWKLRQVMAGREMFATTDLLAPLAARGITLSSSQVYRLVVERPERLSLKILMALCDMLDCEMFDLIEPIAAQRRRSGARRPAARPASGPSGPSVPGSRECLIRASRRSSQRCCRRHRARRPVSR